MTQIYLDNSATTPLCQAAKDSIINNLELYGNPSSLHAKGFEAERLLEQAREKLAVTLGCSAQEIIFTSCGTEANNLAIFGSVSALHRKGNKIITTNSEHPSVQQPMKLLTEKGFEVVYLSTRGGVIDPDELQNALDDKVILVSIMHTNNETGAVYDLNGLEPMIRQRAPGAILHCDFVQGYMKTDVLPKADLISVSGHKIQAPKGIGALYKKRNVRITPWLLGGGQEAGLRSGTPSPLLACAFAEAASQAQKTLKQDIEYVRELKSYIIDGLSRLEGVGFNTPQNPAPNIISVYFPGIKSETLLHFLSEKGIFVSAGSACSSRHRSNRVLDAFGAQKYADFTLRISLGSYNTRQHADALFEATEQAIKTLQRVRGYDGQRKDKKS